MRPSKVTTCAAPSHSISYLLVPDGAFPLPQQLQQQAGKEPGGQGAAGAAGSGPPIRPPAAGGLPRVTLSASHVRSYLDSCRDGSLSVNLSGLFFAGRRSSTVGPSTEAVAE
eukprot:SAG25_NODE_590_length_6705_cov_22.787012_9_plen_112_part_00